MKRLNGRKLIPVLCATMMVFSAVRASAVPITNAFGLLTPDGTITFSEVPLANETALDTQFSAFGVTFANLFASTTLVALSAPAAENFQNVTGCTTSTCMPFDIFFTSQMTAAAFQMITNPGTSTFVAFLNGGLVESFTAATTIPSTTYYGFESIVFDQIHVIPTGGAAAIDNIEFVRALTPVPEPASIMLFGIGLLGAGAARWRQSRA
jgi:PEP-CTERM motif